MKYRSFYGIVFFICSPMISNMADKIYNQSQFQLTVNNKIFAVDAFTSEDYALGKNYKFTLHIHSQQEDLQNLNNCIAVLAVPTEIHGLITAVQGPDVTADSKQNHYIVIMRSPLHPLTQQIHSRVYLKQDISELIKTILQNYNYSYELQLKDKYFQHEIFIQNNASDYDFLIRHLNHFGLFFVFIKDKLIITDDIEQLPSWQGVLKFRPATAMARETESAFSAIMHTTLLTQNIKLRDYNSDTPEQELIAAKTQSNQAISGFGQHYLYGENYASFAEGEQLAINRQQAIDWRRQTLELKTDCPGLIPGLNLTLENHSQYSGSYRILNSCLQGDQTSGQIYASNSNNLTLINTITLIPAGTPYKSPIDKKPVHGIQTAIIEATDEQSPYVDKQGKYHVRMDFDTSNTPKAQATNPMHLRQSHSGQNYGMHFPLRHSTKVLYTCINGDVNRPVLMGIIPEASPVTSQNFSQNILRTFAGNELLTEDKQGQQQLKLSTKAQQHKLHLDAAPNNNKIELSTQGMLNITAAKTKLHHSEANNILHASKDHIVNATNDYKVATKENINLQADQDVKLKAKKDINITAKNMSANSNANIVINTSSKTNITQQNLTINGNNFCCKTTKNLSFKTQPGGTIALQQGAAAIQIDSAGNITLQALQIDVKTPNNNIPG